MVDTDFANVFPQFEWNAICASSGTHFLALSAWMRWCHIFSIRLHVRSVMHLEGDSGVEQGDPLVDLLGSAVILDMVRAALADLASVGIMFFNTW